MAAVDPLDLGGELEEMARDLRDDPEAVAGFVADALEAHAKVLAEGGDVFTRAFVPDVPDVPFSPLDN